MKKGIQYVRALAVLEVIYRDSDKEQSSVAPDEAQCTQSMWWKFVQSTPASYAIDINGNERRTKSASGDYLTLAIQNPCFFLSTCTSAVERLSKIVDRTERLEQAREEMSHGRPIWTRVSTPLL